MAEQSTAAERLREAQKRDTLRRPSDDRAAQWKQWEASRR